MADTDEEKEQKDDVKKQEEPKEKSEAPKENQDDKKAAKSGSLQWIILAAVVAFCAGSGFGLGRLLAGSVKNEPAQAPQTTTEELNQAKDIKSDAPDLSGGESQKTWYYDLEPVVANLDEPGVTRYIRAALTLQINSEVDQKKGVAFFEEKMPLLTDWLTIYFAGLSIEDIRGDKNLKRIKSQILDIFNEKLFPDVKPQIKNILFKELAIQ